MAGISKRVFGADMPEGCKRKMTVRQALAKDSQPGEAITFIKADGSTEELTDFYEEMGGDRGVNFQAGEKGVLGDLGSRTSFARLWCGLQVQKLVEDGKFEAKDFAKDGDAEPKEVEEPGFIYRKEGKDVVKFKIEKYEQVVYEIGNNVLNSEPVNPNMPIIDEPIGDKVGDGFEFAQQFKTNENEYFKPQSGIMDVDSKTKDSMGLIKETTINFIVHNYHDYDKIYSRFFLRPGAQLVCDFGWDTADLYDPSELIEKIQKGESMEELLFGEKGHITNSNGDMETVIGLVTTFDSSIEANGSVKCSVTLTSKNSALLQRDFDGEASRLRERMINQLDTKVLEYAADVFTKGKGMAVLDPDGSYSANASDRKKILAAFAVENLGNNAFIPTEKGNVPGVYWHSIDGENPSDGKNIYVMWGVFEDRILNHDIGFGLDLNDILFGENFSTRFDSSNSYMRYDKNLFDRQAVTKNASGIDFLYPENWDKTYNSIINKRPDPSQEPRFGDEGIDASKEKDLGWIPVRDVYFSLNVLKDALKSSNNMKQVMDTICNKINDNSGGVVDLKLGSNDHASNTVSLIDRKFTPGGEDSEKADFFDKLFIFKPHSPNSFIKTFDLSLKSPSGKMASMYAIQAMAPGMQMFPISDAIDAQLGMKILNDHNEEGGKQETGVVFLPDQGVHRAEQIQRDEDKGANAAAEYDDTSEDRDPFANEMVSANELLNKETPALEKGPKLKKAKAEAEEDMKKREEAQKEGKPAKGSSDDAEYNEGHPSSIKLVANAKEYYENKATSQFRSKKSSPLLPMENSFDIYGCGLINAGDLYRIDLLPERYRDKLYFQIKGVQHSINSSGWGTKIEGIPRFRLKAKEDAEIHVYPDIFVSRNALSKLDGFEEELKYFISELQPIAERPSNPTNIDEIWMFKSRQKGKINHTKEEFLKAGDDGKTDDFKKAETNIKKVKGVTTKTSGDSVSYTQKFTIAADTEYKIVVGGSDWFIFDGNAGMSKFKPLGDAFKMRRNVNA